MEIKTLNAVVRFDGSAVMIERDMFTKQGAGVKVIPVDSIGSVQLRPPSPMSLIGDGVWSVSVAGEVQSSASKRGRGKAKDAAKHDENSVVFGRQHLKQFQALTDAINEARVGPRTTPVVAAAPVVDTAREAVIAQLRQLGSMHHDGAIDDRTFIDRLHTLLPRL